MKIRALLALWLVLWPPLVYARETAPPLTDREIIERLNRLEEGQKRLEESLRVEIRALTASLEQFRQDVKVQFDRIDAQFGRIDAQFDRVDTQFNRVDAQFGRIDAQFDRVVNIMIGILGAFTALAGVTISLMLWDRRTTLRPFEEKTKKMEEDFGQQRQSLHSLLDALRALSQSDEKVAEVLRRFRLL